MFCGRSGGGGVGGGGGRDSNHLRGFTLPTGLLCSLSHIQIQLQFKVY